MCIRVCRFSTDLLLWEPASPSFVEKANAKSMLFSCMDVLQPAATQEDRFQMCKSVLKEGEGIYMRYSLMRFYTKLMAQVMNADEQTVGTQGNTTAVSEMCV